MAEVIGTEVNKEIAIIDDALRTQERGPGMAAGHDSDTTNCSPTRLTHN